jgi:hypothetical protein
VTLAGAELGRVIEGPADRYVAQLVPPFVVPRMPTRYTGVGTPGSIVVPTPRCFNVGTPLRGVSVRERLALPSGCLHRKG